MKLIGKGSRGDEVVDVQRKLATLGYSLGLADVDGIFADETEHAVKKFQRDHQLPVSGEVDEGTWRELVEATYKLGDRPLYLRTPFLRGEDVSKLQSWLNALGFNTGAIDGIFGPATERAVREFQGNVGLPSDGIVGDSTLDALHNLRNILESNARVEFPERLTSSVSLFKGRNIAVDIGHGHLDPGAIGPTGLKESEVCEDLGLRFGNLLELLGAHVLYTRKREQSTELSERARIANDARVDIFVSLHLNGSSKTEAAGTSTYYFASGNRYSRKGKRLAELIQKELLSSLDRKDNKIRGKNFTVLRTTKMPAVLVEPVFITNPEEERLLRKEAFRQKIAVAIFDGVQGYLRGCER
ncbi:MAG TPA: hypothetical protein DCW86_02705 [Actinobacteria bacterium]|nr:hypothetical protein [Actinomycetota bacterium]